MFIFPTSNAGQAAVANRAQRGEITSVLISNFAAEMKWSLEMKRFSKVIIALSLAMRVEVTLG